jgi:nitroreductase
MGTIEQNSIQAESGRDIGGSATKRLIFRRVPLGLFLIVRRLKYARWLLKFQFSHFRKCWRSTSIINRGDTRSKLAALVTISYHGVEKGLSLSATRPGFGRKLILELLDRMGRYEAAFGWDRNLVHSLEAIEAYVEFNRQCKCDISPIDEKAERLRESLDGEPAQPNATISRTRSEFIESSKLDLTAFFNSRSSFRQFADQKVDPADIEAAVLIAQRSPCVCNRQSGNVWIIDEIEDVADALRIQGGARGFAAEVPLVLAVTSDLANFQAVGEYNQCWTDGGLFAMSLMWGLHSRGLGACALNWDQGLQVDKEFRERFKIPEDEMIIMLLAVGHPPEEFQVARSPRRELSEVLSKVPSRIPVARDGEN